MGNSESGIGLVLCSIPLLVHGIEVWHPTLTRFAANCKLKEHGGSIVVKTFMNSKIFDNV